MTGANTERVAESRPAQLNGVMERIHYAGDSLLTGTDIARALIDYASALARANQSAVVNIPVRAADGSIGRANFLIGPASQVVSEEERSADDEVTDPELVERLARETRRLQPTRPVSTAEPQGAERGLDLIDDI